MFIIDESRQRQEAYRNLIADLDILLSPEFPMENSNDSQELFKNVRLISFFGHALTNYIFMTQNFVDPYDQKRREIIYELATSILQSQATNSDIFSETISLWRCVSKSDVL